MSPDEIKSCEQSYLGKKSPVPDCNTIPLLIARAKKAESRKTKTLIRNLS